MDNRSFEANASATPPSLPASPSAGYPTDGNAGTGTPATIPGDYWFHQIGEEFRAVIVAAGLTPDRTTLNQLLTALRSVGVFQTPPQFDTSTKAATMAAVQRALGNFSAVNYVVGAATLPAAYAGMVSVFGGGSAFSQTIPLLSALPEGASFPFENNGTVAQSVLVSGSDTITAGQNSGYTSISIGPGEFALLFKTGSVWRLAGSAALKYEAQFASSLASNYRQSLPGGALMQWGRVTVGASSSQAVTFPMAFPTEVQVILFGRWTIGGGYGMGATSPTTAGFTANNQDTTSITDSWFAIGR